MNKKIFTADEIKEICGAFSSENESLDGIELLEANHEELCKKIDSLPSTEQNKFIEKVRETVQKYADIESKEDETNSEEAALEHQESLREFYDSCQDDLKQYILN